MSFDYKQAVPESWQARLRWEEIPDDLKEQIGRFGLDMHSMGKHVTGEISEIKYDGKLIVLDDGSRWEVDGVDATSCEFWAEYSKVVIIDGDMYNIEDSEKVGVQREY